MRLLIFLTILLVQRSSSRFSHSQLREAVDNLHQHQRNTRKSAHHHHNRHTQLRSRNYIDETNIDSSLVSRYDNTVEACTNKAHPRFPEWTGDECENDGFMCVKEGLYNNCCKCRPECCGKCAKSTTVIDTFQACVVEDSAEARSVVLISPRSDGGGMGLPLIIGLMIVVGGAVYVLKVRSSQNLDSKAPDSQDRIWDWTSWWNAFWTADRRQKEQQSQPQEPARRSSFSPEMLSETQSLDSLGVHSSGAHSSPDLNFDYDKLKRRRENALARKKAEFDKKNAEAERIRREAAEKEQAELDEVPEQKVQANISIKSVERRIAAARARQKEKMYGKKAEVEDDVSAVESTVSYDEEDDMVKVTIVMGRGFTFNKKGIVKKDIPDVYCMVRFGSSAEQWRTSTIQDNTYPQWNESKNYQLSDENQKITIDCWDENDPPEKDDFYGSVKVPVGKVLYMDGQIDLELKNGSKPTGITITLECKTFRRKRRKKKKGKGKGGEPPKLVELMIESGRGFETERKRLVKDIPDVYCVVKQSKTSMKWRTATVIDNELPVWNEMMMTNRTETVVVEVWDANEKHKDDFYGSFKVQVRKILNKPDQQLECEVKHENIGQGLYITLSCKQLTIPATPVIIDDVATVKIRLIRGLGFKTERRGRKMDIPDVYCIIKVEGSPKKWKSKTITDDTIPEWNESEVFEVKNGNQTINIVAYDEEAPGKEDDLYGNCEIAVSELVSNHGPIQLELFNRGQGTNLFVTLAGEFVWSRD